MDILSLHRPSLRADDLTTIIIPAFNEEAGIGRTLQSLRDEPRLSGAKVIVISDGSSDRTAEVATEHGATVIENWSNLGYGASLKRGIQRATTELIAWFDADGQHQPSDLADMVERIHREEGTCRHRSPCGRQPCRQETRPRQTDHQVRRRSWRSVVRFPM